MSSYNIVEGQVSFFIHAFIFSSEAACRYTQKKQDSRRATKFLNIEDLSFIIICKFQATNSDICPCISKLKLHRTLVLNPCIYTGSTYFAYKRKRIQIAAHFLEGVNSRYIAKCTCVAMVYINISCHKY
jgi:hypothetical protein